MDGGKDLKRNPALRISLLLIAFLLTSVWLFATEPEIGEMVLVERGTFIMGDASENAEHGERPAHVVTLTYDFFIGKYEVTFDQYDVFCDATGRSRSGDRDWGRGLMPAINVSWWDAIAYCNWLSENEELPLAYDINGNFLDTDGNITFDPSSVAGYRLPTEAEWEFAARGGNESHNYARAGGNNVENVAWYKLNASSKTHEVGGKVPNELGLYDMSGNVWEWVSDRYGLYGEAPLTNPFNGTEGTLRVNRGGSWIDCQMGVRIICRGSSLPTYANVNVGFRIARTER